MLRPFGILPRTVVTPPGPPKPPPPPPPKPAPPSRCMRSRNSWIRCCRSSSLPPPKSCVRPCAPLMLTDSVGPSAPAPFRGRLERSLLPWPPASPPAPPKPEFPPASEESALSIARLWNPRPVTAIAALLLFDRPCWREARISSAPTFADGFSGFSTTSWVKAANPMNSTRTTYLPRVMPDNPNLPSEFVAAAYFFPVSVLAAVTVTPGSEVLPLRVEPVISYVGAAAGVVADCVVRAGEDGVASCASNLDAKRITAKWRMRMPRAIDFKSWSPPSELGLRRIAFWFGCGFASGRRVPGRVHSSHLAHFPQLLPLLGGKDHHVLRHKHIILDSSAYHDVIAWLDVCHSDTLASSAQRSLLVQLQRLRDIVRSQNREFRRVDGFHFTHNEILSQFAEASATDDATARTADHLCGHAVIRILLPAHEYHVADLEIFQLRALPVLAVFRLIRNLHCHRRAVRLGQLQRSFVDRRNLSKQRLAPAVYCSLRQSCCRRGFLFLTGCGRRRRLRSPGCC